MTRSTGLQRRAWQLLAAVLLVLATWLASPRQEALAMPPCDGGTGPECKKTEACVKIPGTDIEACFRRFYYYELGDYFE